MKKAFQKIISLTAALAMALATAAIPAASASSEPAGFTISASAGWNYTDSIGAARHADHFITMRIGDSRMMVDDIEREIDPGRGTTAQIVGDRTLVPIRAIVEAMDGRVDWEEATQKITMTRGDTIVEMWINSRMYTIDSFAEYMDAAPIVINDRTMVPVRFVAEAFGAYVDWNEERQGVAIMYDDWIGGGVIDYPAQQQIAEPGAGGDADGAIGALTPVGGDVLASAYISPENTKLTEPGGVTVEFSPAAVGQPTAAVIRRVVSPPAIEGGVGGVKAYDIRLEGQTELRGVARINAPLQAGSSEAACAGWYNEATREWEPVAARYNRAAQSVIIDATHLSEYAVFKITNAAQATAMLAFIAPDEQADVRNALDNISGDLAALNSMGAYERNGPNPPESLVGAGAKYVKNIAEGLELSDHATNLLFGFSWLDIAADSIDIPIDFNVVKGYKVDLTDVGLIAAMARLAIAANNGGFDASDRKVALKAVPDWVFSKLFNLYGGAVTSALNIVYFTASKSLDLLTDTVLTANEERYKSLAKVYFEKVSVRTDAAWYDKLTPILEKAATQQQRDAQITGELDSWYASFWKDDANIAAAMAEGGRLGLWGENWMGGALGAGVTAELRDKISKTMRDDFIKNDLPRIMDACAKNITAKQVQLRNKKLAELTKKLNRELTLRIKDNSRTYDGYIFKLETSKGASPATWNGFIKGAETDFAFTFAGFVTADMPNHLCVYGDGKKVLDIPFTVAGDRLIQLDLTASNWKFEPANVTDAVFDAPIKLQLKGAGLGDNVKQVKIEYSRSDGAVYYSATAPVIGGGAESVFEYTFERPTGYGQGYDAFTTDVVATITDANTGAPLGKVKADVGFNIPTVRISSSGQTSYALNKGGDTLVNFSALVSKSGDYKYTWDFGDGTIVNAGANVSHAYKVKETSRFTVWVTLYNADGSGAELSSDTVEIIITDQGPPENNSFCACGSSSCTGGADCACMSPYCSCRPITLP